MESPNNIGLTPTHIPFPDYGTSQDIFNEVFISVFALFCAFLQFLHIYKTIFWLPELHQTSAVHWDLIDPHLVVFIVVIISRRLIYAFLRITIDKTVISNKKKKLYKTVGKFSLISIFVVILTVCLIQIFIAHGYLAIFCLSY
uniref:Uncharacterized protein n=1 Tax=Megaselia scalaris TaxID=36166 RepID=T1GP26_MEGSC